MKARMLPGFLVCFLVCLTASLALADTVKLKSGETYEGEITKENEKNVFLRTRDAGFKIFDRSEIDEITRGDAKKLPEKEEPKPVKEAAPDGKPAAADEQAKSPEPDLDVVVMKDGTIHTGTITSENNEFLTMRIPQSGYKILRREDIREERRTPKDTKEEKVVEKTPVTLPASDVTDILKKLTSKEPISASEALKQIVKLGPGALPTLLRLLRSEPAEAELRIVAQAIAELRDENTVGEVRSLLSSESRTSQLNALAVLERIGDAEALDVLLKTMLGEDAELGSAASGAVATTLRTRPNNHEIFMVVHDAARSAKKEGKTRIAGVLGASASRFATSPLLTLMADWEASVKVSAVIAVGRLGFSDEGTCTEVRRLLKSEDTQVKREAALTLGRLQDLESVDSLIALLEDENRGIRKNAHWALKNITGLRFPDNHLRWKVWWDKESKNHRERRDSFLTTLRTGTNDDRLKAMEELSGMRLGTREIASALLEQFSNGDKRIRARACEALVAIGARHSVTDLIGQLDDVEQTVIAAAHGALKAITGQDLPPEKEAWEKWLRSSNW